MEYSKKSLRIKISISWAKYLQIYVNFYRLRKYRQRLIPRVTVRSYRSLAKYLRHYVNNEQTNWDEWLSYAMFIYNTTPYIARTYFFQLIYGHQPTALLQSPKLTYAYIWLRTRIERKISRDESGGERNRKTSQNSKAKNNMIKRVEKTF